jgi:hypothetical protein
MGEIKSTLDLVMERTSHLSMTPEEKARQREADFKKRLQGLLQQYADEKLGLQELLKSIGNLQAETGTKDARQVLGMVCKRVDPDEDTQAWIALLASLAPQVTGPLEDRLASYSDQKEHLVRNGAQQMRDRLAHDHAIHGSAVLPAPEQDEACRQELSTLREKTLAQIAALCTQGS